MGDGECICDFNPRSREGSDHPDSELKNYAKISIHAPAKGATKCNICKRAGAKDFNPRSREGSDLSCSCKCFSMSISIHAPAKGATLFFRAFFCAYIISIHAPAKGATYVSQIQEYIQKFQSTLPRRERLI